MASNDLMMRIQLLVDSGRATQELKRLQSAIQGLRDQVSRIENTRLAPLTQQIDDLRKSAAQLKTVNLGNFSQEITDLRNTFQRLGVATNNLDQLKKAFQDVVSAKAARSANDYLGKIKSVNQELNRAKELTITQSGQTFNRDLARQQGSLAANNTLLKIENDLILDAKKLINEKNKELANSAKLYADQRAAQGQVSKGFLERSLGTSIQTLAQQQETLRNTEKNLKGLKEQLKSVRQEASQLSRTKILTDGLSGTSQAAVDIRNAAQAYKAQNEELQKQKKILAELRAVDVRKTSAFFEAGTLEREKSLLQQQKQAIASTRAELARVNANRKSSAQLTQQELSLIQQQGVARVNALNSLKREEDLYKNITGNVAGLRDQIKGIKTEDLSSVLKPIADARKPLQEAKDRLKELQAIAAQKSSAVKTAALIDPTQLQSGLQALRASSAALAVARTEAKNASDAVRDLRTRIASVQPEGMEAINKALVSAKKNFDQTKALAQDYRNELARIREQQRLAKDLKLPDQRSQLADLQRVGQELKNLPSIAGLQGQVRDLRAEMQRAGQISFKPLDTQFKTITDQARSLREQILFVQQTKPFEFGKADQSGIRQTVDGLVGVQNKIRELVADRNKEKQTAVSSANTKVKLYKAEVNALEKLAKAYRKQAEAIDPKESDRLQKRINKINEALQRTTGKSYADQASALARIEKLQTNSAIKGLESAKAAEQISKKYGEQIAQLKQAEASAKNQIAGLTAQRKNIEEIIKARREEARLARDSVKTRTGGLFDTQEALNQARTAKASLLEQKKGLQELGRERARVLRDDEAATRAALELNRQRAAARAEELRQAREAKVLARNEADAKKAGLRSQLSGLQDLQRAANQNLANAKQEESLARTRVQTLSDAAKVAKQVAQAESALATQAAANQRLEVAERQKSLDQAKLALAQAKDSQAQRVAGLNVQLRQAELEKATQKAAVENGKAQIKAIDATIRRLEQAGKVREQSFDQQRRAIQAQLAGQQATSAEIAARMAPLEAKITQEREKQKSAIAEQVRLRDQEAAKLAASKAALDGLITAERQRNLSQQAGIQQRIQGQQSYADSLKSGVTQLKEAVRADKEALKSYREGQKAFEDQIRAQITAAKQRIASGQISKQELQAERQAIQESIRAQKDASKVYQDRLREQRSALQDALRGENERIRALKQTVSELNRATGADVERQRVAARSALGAARSDRTDLRRQIADTEGLARAEAQRIRELENSTRALGRQRQELTTLGRLFKGSSGVAREFGAALRFALGPQMAGFAAAGSIIQLISGFFAANKEIENLNRGLNAITGSGTLYFEELRRIANTTGQSMIVVTDSFLQLVAASKGTRLEGEATRKIFENVSRALVITGADAVRSRRAFLALAQMMSKGQVYAEELRQQLSEALPGSVQIFAKALQITPQAMLNLMKQGKVSADSLILFAEELGKTYGAVGEDMFTFSQKAAVLQNELQRLFVEIGKTGIWQALGDALLGARDLIGGLADGVGTFGDTAKREIGAVVAAFRTIDLSGVADAFGALGSGWLDFVKSTYDQLFGLIRQIPQLIGELQGVASQLGTRLDIGAPPTSGGWFDWLNALDRKFGTTGTDLRRYWENFTDLISRPVPVPNFSEWQQQAGAGFTLQINRLQRELQRLGQQQINLETRGVGPDDSLYQEIAQRIDEINRELRSLEQESVRAFEAAAKAAEKKNQELAEGVRLTKEQRAANQEIEQNRIFLQGFDPKVRTSIQDAYRALQDYQRSSETLLRLEKESEQAIINRVRSAKKILDVQNDIQDATQRAVEAQRSFDQNRARDAREVLQLTLSQADALRQAEENSKRLREGRAKAGVYFTPEQRKASDDEFQAFKLRKQAQEELEKAAKETNREIQEGNLENAKLLLEQANTLLVSAGNTYLVKKNNEELLGIQKQLSAEAKDQRKQEESRRRGLELLAQAQDLLGKSQADIPASVRDVYLEQVEDLAKKAQAIFAEIGFFEGLEKTAQIRGSTAQVLEDSAGALQKRIDDAITRFNAQTKKDADSAVKGLSAAATGLLALQRELEQKIVETTSDAAREQLQSRLNDVKRDLKTLEREYLQVLKRLQDAGKTPTQIEFVSKTDLTNLPKPPPIQVAVEPVIQNAPFQVRVREWVKEFWNEAFKDPAPPLYLNVKPVVPPDMQERLRDQVRPIDVPVDLEGLKDAAQAANQFGSTITDAGDAVSEWSFDEVERYLAASIKDGRAVAQAVGDIRTAQILTNEAAAKYGQQIEENKNRSIQLVAAAKWLSDINLTPSQQTMEFKSNEEKFLTSLAKVRGTTESVRQEIEKPMELGAQLAPNFAQPFQQATQLAGLLQTTVEATQYQNLDRVKQLLQEINALQAQQPQVSFEPIVDSAELQAKRKQLELELAKPVKVPVGVEIARGALESAKQAVQSIPDANMRVSTVLVEDSVTGVIREVRRLTAQDTPLPLTPDIRTELLDQEFRKIDGQLEKWNRTAGAGIAIGFRTAAERAQDFNTLVDQTNQKMRAIQENAKRSDAELAAAFAQQRKTEVQVKVDREKADAEFRKFNEETQRLLEDRDPIRLLVDKQNVVEAQRLIGEIQADLNKLKDAGATNIEVRFDEKTGKLTVTADTSQADASVSETIAKINASTAVLNVRVRYNDPGFTPRNTSVDVTARRWGGPIPGYGGGDRVRALLEPGEFVLRKEAVKAIGLDALFAMNRQKRLPRAPRVRDTVGIPKMASGGPIMGSPITINVPGRQPIRVSGSRDQAEALANLLTSVGRAL